MKRNWKRISICAAIALGSGILTLLIANVRFFQLLDLKANDAHFVLRGKVPTSNIVIIGIDEKAQDKFPEPSLFWQRYYADAIRGAADAGAKVLVLDVAFGIPVSKWEPENDGVLAEAVTYAQQKMSVVSAFVASQADQSNPAFAVPINMMASAFGMSAMANLTDDADDFVRSQELIEAPKDGVPPEALTRSMALRAAEKFLNQDAHVRNGHVFLGDREIATDGERTMLINYAGPADSFPKVSIYDFVQAERAGDIGKLAQWVRGKAVFLGPDVATSDRHATPFFTAFGLTNTWMTPGVEIHANAFRTILTGDYLKPVPAWARLAALALVAGATVSVSASFAASQTMLWSALLLAVALVATHIFFLSGWLFSTTEILMAFVWALIGGIVYRFATAEKKSSFFKSAVALFVGKQVASSLEQSGKIGLTGKREMVTILFTDIRGFTAFCESKDPALVVDLLNVYMAQMVAIIVRYHGHVNKFIGDGILAVFSDDDEGARPGDHAFRAVTCAAEMVTAPGDFKTGAGLHTGEVVIGNVGSSDKMEFTVLGDTVNLASRLESLNKENKTRLLMSDETREMAGGSIDTLFLGDVPVRGKTVPMKLYTVTSLMEVRKEQPVHATEVIS
jgi:adenylate cyclase